MGTQIEPKKVTHVIFDLDGTLIDSTDHLIGMIDQMLLDYGAKSGDRAFATSRITDEMRFLVPNLTTFDDLCGKINASLGRDILVPVQFRREVLAQLPARPIGLKPGVERLVRHLHRHRVPMAIASGTFRAFYDSMVRRFADSALPFERYFSHAICAYDDETIKAKKPAPDIFLAAAKRFEAPPADMSSVLIFEDSVRTGLRAALASGARTCFVSAQPIIAVTDEERQTIDRADLVLQNMLQFKPELFGLPPFDDQ